VTIALVLLLLLVMMMIIIIITKYIGSSLGVRV